MTEPGPPEFDPIDSRLMALVEEMVAAWRQGNHLTAADLLAREPDLGDQEMVRLIFEEICLRQESGMEVDPLDFLGRYPRLWPELELLLECQKIMEADLVSHDLPSSGEDFAGFRLLAELGRGVLGKVFLASDLGLADRPVVLKVTPLGREEHLSLARLQHMNIVPLYSAQVLPDRHLQILCMPFLGGASLAQVLGLLEAQAPAGRTGEQVIEALDLIQAGLPVSLPARGPFRSYIAHSSYTDAICWIGMCLADGLQYAHERNFVHMDIKPSNVLLAGDGQPMLLDFHLAREPLRPGDPPPSTLGGTPGSMAPEQEEAMTSVSEGRPILYAIDGRADIYSLGVLLYEALGGPGPVPDGPARRPLSRCNPRVSTGLSDIIHKCMEPRPSDRYADAASLASDLRRFLDGKPLQGVSNRNPLESWKNWRRRHPQALIRGLIVLVAAVTASAAAALLWAGYLHRIREVEGSIAAGRSYIDRHQYAEARKALNRGLALVEHLPAVDYYREELTDGLARAEKRDMAEDLHRLAEITRFRYGIDPPPPEEAFALIRRGHSIWMDRGLLLGPAGGRPEPDVDRTIRADFLELALARANFIVRLASPDEADQAKRQALRLLNAAEKLLGPAAAIDRERAAYGGSSTTGASARMSAPSPESARDHFDLGKSFLRTGETSKAAEQFQLGLRLRPQDFWLNFYQGLCAYRLGHLEDSVGAFRVCIALSPESAECYYNRALAHGSLGRLKQAIEDYSRALKLNPSLFAAALNLGMIHYKAGQLTEAADALARALASTSSTKQRGMVLYNMSLVDLASGDRPAALANLEAAVDCGHEEARTLMNQLRK